MSDHVPGLITRRRFLGLLAGTLGIGAAAWSINRTDAAAVAGAGSAGGAAPITALPPVMGGGTVVDAAASGPAEAVAVAPHAFVDGLCREAWGARAISGTFTPHVPVRMTVHHTASLLVDAAEAPSLVRDHQAYHQLNLGWPDIAYHFIIDGSGVIYEGRPVDVVGDTSTDYDPTGHFLVACEGNFNEQPVPDAQYQALVDLLAWAATTHAIDPATISGHRDWAATACPGAALYEPVADRSLENAVRARQAAGGVGLNLRCGAAAAAVVSGIEAGMGTPLSAIPWDDRGVE